MTDLTSLSYTAEHEWISFEGDPSTSSGQATTGTVVATVGITDYAAEKLGDVVFVDLPGTGTAVDGASVVGEIESTKSVGELYAPLAGEVVEANQQVIDDPSLVNSDPFGSGWLIKLRVDVAAIEGLLDRDAYLALTGGDE